MSKMFYSVKFFRHSWKKNDFTFIADAGDFSIRGKECRLRKDAKKQWEDFAKLNGITKWRYV